MKKYEKPSVDFEDVFLEDVIAVSQTDANHVLGQGGYDEKWD